jgi:hypothetical protein
MRVQCLEPQDLGYFGGVTIHPLDWKIHGVIQGPEIGDEKIDDETNI